MGRTIIDMPIKVNRFSVSNKIVDKKYDSLVLEKYTDTTLKTEKSSKNGLKIADLIRNVIVYSLDLLLMIAVLPYILYQWALKNERSMIILKAIIEIMLEVMMWLIFAGVSILVTAAFVMEELYFNKDDDKDLKRSIDLSNDINDNHLKISKKKEQPEHCSH